MDNFNISYIGERKDIIDLVPENARKILDVGCSIGTVGGDLKKRQTAEVTGIELDTKMAEAAKTKLDRVIAGDIETLNLNTVFKPGYFDCIILADILEHLKNPWQILNELTNFLSEDGVVIASIPNIRHYSAIVNLIFWGYWPYRERGIFDRSHLRFFTLRNIEEMFANAGLKIDKVQRTYRIIESISEKFAFIASINRFSRCLSIPFIRNFFTFQYIVLAKKR